MHDLVIRGGSVVDGTGSPARTADVAVSAGRIVAVGKVGERGRREIAAAGAVVTPGFIDIHTHYDAQVRWDPLLTPSSWHGVTTVVVGNCGVGFAPVAPERRQWVIGLMEGVEDIPGEAIAAGIGWEWESFPEYLDALARQPLAIDVGAHIAHGALRAHVMGEHGATAQTASADELQTLSRLVREAIGAGALGVSSNRTVGHRSIDGAPVPGTFADENELLAIGRAMAAAGAGVLQIVPAGTGGRASGDPDDAPEREVALMVRLACATGRPLSFLVMQTHERPDRWRSHFDAVHAARAAGVPIYPQVAARSFGMLVGHQSRMNPFRARPSYAPLAELPLAERVARLRDPELRRRILSEAPLPAARRGISTSPPPDLFEHLFPLGDPPDYEPAPQASVAARARAQGCAAEALAYDLMLQADGRELLLYPLLNYGRGSYDALYEMMTDPLSIQGLGDGGAHCGIVCDASMTTYMLSHWVRDRTRGPRLGIEHAVRRLTSDAAALYQLSDRGIVAPGHKADLNVIDMSRLQLARPELAHDLPTGAPRMIQRASGYIATLVAGEVVTADGEATDARPGRVVRGGAQVA
jgi:N-acyl-D-aspartate/D-glutamate deacylase